MPSSTQQASTAAGGSVYSLPGLLSFVYDIWVLGISNFYIWRCPTRTTLLPFFKTRRSAHNHLDIGVGTGYYLAHADFPKSANVTLCDLNPNSLEAAKVRLGKGGLEAGTLLHDVEKPLLLKGQKFDSISLMYLLHCMPGPPERKAAIFDHLRTNLADGGLVFGSTILGQGVSHNLAGKTLMNAYNRKGIFGNAEDGVEIFVEALRRNFEEVEVDIMGVVLLFTARRPKN